QFKVRDLKGLDCEHLPVALCAAGALLTYVQHTQRTALPHIQRLQIESLSDSVILDEHTRRNLELTHNIQGGTENTLLAILDRTSTPMGSRLLRRCLNRPLRNQTV